MTKTSQNISGHYSGDSLVINVSTEDGSGNNQNLTSADIEWVMAEDEGESAIVTKNNTGDGGVTITDDAAGEFEVSLDPEDTENLSGLYYHEAEVTDSNGDVATVMTGHIEIKEDSA